jgi:hypothetical protein
MRMNTKSPGRSNVPPGQTQAILGGGNTFAPMTFGAAVAGKQVGGHHHFNNNSISGENYNYSIPSDNLYPIMHGNNFNSAQTTNF